MNETREEPSKQFGDHGYVPLLKREAQTRKKEYIERKKNVRLEEAPAMD